MKKKTPIIGIAKVIKKNKMNEIMKREKKLPFKMNIWNKKQLKNPKTRSNKRKSNNNEYKRKKKCEKVRKDTYVK